MKTKPFDLNAIKNGAKWGIFENNKEKCACCSDAWKYVELLFGSENTAIHYDGLHVIIKANGVFKKTYDDRYNTYMYQILLIEEPKLASDLSEVKVGDKVWEFRFGWGTIAAIQPKDKYSIFVKFSPETLSIISFTKDGRGHTDVQNQSLFLTEIKFEIPEI